MDEVNGVKTIELVVEEGPTHRADVSAGTEPTDWLTNARDVAWAACLHHGRAVTARELDGTPICRVSCEWLE